MLILKGPSRSLPPGIRSVRDLLDALFADVELEHRDCAIDADSAIRLTFGELKRTSATMASHLRENTRVGICMHPSIELMVTLVGVVRRGIPYVALDPNLPPERLAHIVRDSGVDVVIGDGRTTFPDGAVPFRSFAAIAHAPDAPWEGRNDVREEDVFCILYTSGSSGTPKSVPIPHRAVLNRLHWQWADFPLHPRADVGSLKTSLGFVDSIAELWAPLLKGVPLVAIPKHILLDPGRMVEALNRFRMTTAVLIPSLLRRLIDHIAVSGERPTTLRHVVASGEVLPRDLCHDFFRVFGDGGCILSNYYGTSEVMGDVVTQSFRSMSDVDRYGDGERVAIGRPIDNTTLILENIDEHGIGEMTFSGPSVASGESFRTGDRAKVVGKGVLVYWGRADGQVKIAGSRLELGEVEAVLRNRCACKDPVVLFDGEKVVAFLADDEPHLDPDSLARWLPSHAIPRVVRLGMLPRLAGSGKADRRRLLEIHALMEALVEAGIDIGSIDGALHSDFFSLGGTSLNVISTISKLRRHSFDVSVDSFLRATKLEDVVAAMRPRGTASTMLREPSQPRSEGLSMVAGHDLDMKSAVHLLTTSFVEEESLMVLLHGGDPERKAICWLDTERLFTDIWPYAMHESLSFGIERNGQLVGLCLNLDDEHLPAEMPELRLVGMIVNFLAEAEGPAMARLRARGIRTILHGFAVAVDRSHVTNPSQRVAMMLFLERALLEIAKEKGYQAVVTTNTNPLTQDMAEHVLGYDVESVVDHLADWVDAAQGGCRPFAAAPPTQSVKVAVKYS
ncbi:non-ribosomal peptide synthetase [Pendulispora rubella]|uniref:Non-ribosomal peptide synthetase n=1 Tax=Pendulispora rubella TaxID=2741070 RepID=A0ABZ2L9C0_9BACT